MLNFLKRIDSFLRYSGGGGGGGPLAYYFFLLQLDESKIRIQFFN
jgi:hypothetical protein